MLCDIIYHNIDIMPYCPALNNIVHLPADIAIVVPATIPMATPLGRGGGMGGAYIAAGMPLG